MGARSTAPESCPQKQAMALIPDYRVIVIHMRAIVLLLFGVASLLAQQSRTDPRWAPLRFLIGEWVGEGTGEPGQGEGGFSFLPDQGGRILMRKNYANYPATKDKAAYSHTDLTI